MASAIRQIKYEDFDAYAKIIKQLSEQHILARPDIFHIPKPSFPLKRYFYEYLESADKTILSAWDNDNLLGVALLRLEGKGSKIGTVIKPHLVLYIDDIVVDEAARGKKIGKKLLEAAMAWGKKYKATSMNLFVYNFNQDAQKFYKREGFLTLKTEMEKVL